MRNLTWLVVVGTFVCCSSARASDQNSATQRDALDTALQLAGPLFANLPIVLTPVMPWTASPGAEAWTIYDERGKGNRIVLYTGSVTFRCAATPHLESRRCALQLASLVVHEAWHFRSGQDEAGAYQAQLTFLIQNDASSAQVSAVRRARDRVLAAKQKTRPN